MCTTNSMMSSHEQAVVLLRGFLEGKYSLEQLAGDLRDSIVIDFSLAPRRREIRFTLKGIAKIVVERKHLRRMLQRYIDGQISGIDLSNWAAFLLGAPMFIPEGKTDEERAEAGDGPVWDILQRLASPMIFDGLDRQVAQRYLEMIE